MATASFGFKFRRPSREAHVNGDLSAPLRPERLDDYIRKARESVLRTYQGYNKGEDRAIMPQVLIRVDPQFYYLDLRVTVVDQIKALEWRTNAFSGARFGTALEQGLRAGFERWFTGQFREAIFVDHAGRLEIKGKAV